MSHAKYDDWYCECGSQWPCQSYKAMTQTTRLLAFLRTHPQATSLEITLACGIVNTTGRISDARAAGINVVCETRSDGRKGYRIVERFEQQGMAL